MNCPILYSQYNIAIQRSILCTAFWVVRIFLTSNL